MALYRVVAFAWRARRGFVAFRTARLGCLGRVRGACNVMMRALASLQDAATAVFLEVGAVRMRRLRGVGATAVATLEAKRFDCKRLYKPLP